MLRNRVWVAMQIVAEVPHFVDFIVREDTWNHESLFEIEKVFLFLGRFDDRLTIGVGVGVGVGVG